MREAAPVIRAVKYRQAAFAYLHVSLLYEAAGYAMWRAGRLPFSRLGPPWLWLIIGAGVAALVFLGLLRWQNDTFTRVVWGIHALRLPPLIHGAFFAGANGLMPSSFYIMAIVVVVVNLWMLARAAWDL